MPARPPNDWFGLDGLREIVQTSAKEMLAMAAAARSDPDPLWLTRLRDALFVALPETDEAFVHEGHSYVCHRRLDYGERLVFHETWLDPQTYRPQRTWQQEVEAGAFAGAPPETVFQQHLAVLLAWLAQVRPHGVVRERQAPFSPHRFAHMHQRRSL